MTGTDLAGRRAIVTGGAQGLGEGMAVALAAAGARVAVADVQDDPGLASPGLGDEHTFVHLDVTDDAGWATAVEQAVERLGGLDILVNNGGSRSRACSWTSTRHRHGAQLTSTSGDGARPQARAPGDAPRRRLPAMAERSSTLPRSRPRSSFPGIGLYSATKSAIDRLHPGGGDGVRPARVRRPVNCIYPGLVPTAMGAGQAKDVADIGLFGSPQEAVEAVVGLTPSGRLGEVADMADAVIFLASDSARFITGIGLPVDGGMGM
jgi:NAD(P)-dependent dehydrogenase (short-subunit alcohol dehydrogenase family)